MKVRIYLENNDMTVAEQTYLGHDEDGSFIMLDVKWVKSHDGYSRDMVNNLSINNRDDKEKSLLDIVKTRDEPQALEQYLKELKDKRIRGKHRRMLNPFKEPRKMRVCHLCNIQTVYVLITVGTEHFWCCSVCNGDIHGIYDL